jgi:hypothetical protein
METLSVRWFGTGRKAQCQANPNYPNGIDLDMSSGRVVICATELPYPAPEVGQWRISCQRCGLSILVTAAGRTDDPRSVRVSCKGH